MTFQSVRIAALCAILQLVVACSESPTGGSEARFHGEWVVVSNSAQKLPCELSPLDEKQIHELRIDQNGSAVLLDLEGIELQGNVQDELLLASGSGETGETVDLSLMLANGHLSGEMAIAGNCSEFRNVTARRRGEDVDLSGHWEFELTVVGEGGCEHISDYQDCFRIFQTGNELLVVDDVGGNLAGRVLGNIARIERDTAQEQTILLFFMDPQTQTMTGQAIRSFASLGCRTDLEFVARRSETPCALHGS